MVAITPHRNFVRRLLVDMVRVREEAQGCPADFPAADAEARGSGATSLVQRIAVRAEALPDVAALRAGIHVALRRFLWMVLALVVLLGIAGALAASAALGGTEPVSLPLALLLVVGLNMAMLLLWLLLQCFWPGAGAGLGSVLKGLAGRLGSGSQGAPPVDPAMLALRVLLGGAAGRWLIGAAVHLAWISFTLAALLILALLLSMRSYGLSWETTLLSPDGLQTWAHALSAGPALLGLPGAGHLPLRAPMSAADTEAWAAWLLAAVVCYGLLPRLLAFLACLGLASAALRRSNHDVHQPGFARLRTRLMPEHGPARLIDPARAATPLQDEGAGTASGTALPEAPWHGLGLEMEVLPEPHASDWIWLGMVDDAESRAAVRKRLLDDVVRALVIVVRAGATPDRGNLHCVREFMGAAGAPTYLLLAAGDEADGARRDEHWHALARQLGAGIRVWPAGTAPADTLRGKGA